MSSEARTLDNVKDVISSAHKNVSTVDKIEFYDKWAENYETDVAILDYSAPGLAANSVSTSFTGDPGAALVLDVACGTGLVARQMKKHGFGHFVGVDGSKGMLELAKNTGLYEDVRQCMLGDDELPVQWGSFDVVLIVGALSVGQVPVCVTKELCKATKPGGLVCMTTRSNQDNVQYKASLEQQLKLMEEEGLWSCVNVGEVEEWERAVTEHEEGYIRGCVYLYRVSDFKAPPCQLSFTGDPGAALVLDVACGTGLVARQMKQHGFGHFVGVDGSKGMLELAKNTGLYEDVRQCMLGDEELPVQWGSFDVVLIVGALLVGHVPVGVTKELCKATKPGGLVCMTTRKCPDNAQYSASLEQQLKLMEEEGLWSCVNVTHVEEWQRAVSEHDEGYARGCVYLYRVSDVDQ
ncbi:hypothetical protein NHX12_009486 [Muraenolepis orangiensis]|uniref:Methyltransferase domain-containing protein n=1 Tax=Muraenolepis orangiensis TaxID=630683 RepID=A0A9Q0DL94_9TELE|nr:hypothetical protein NHX12_009486 [Muraenolepis orangiensis]